MTIYMTVLDVSQLILWVNRSKQLCYMLHINFDFILILIEHLYPFIEANLYRFVRKLHKRRWQKPVKFYWSENYVILYLLWTFQLFYWQKDWNLSQWLHYVVRNEKPKSKISPKVECSLKRDASVPFRSRLNCIDTSSCTVSQKKKECISVTLLYIEFAIDGVAWRKTKSISLALSLTTRKVQFLPVCSAFVILWNSILEKIW